MTTSSERYAALVQWVEEGGGSLHPAVEIAQMDGMRGSFRAKDTVQRGDVIVALPVSKTLSYLNAINGHPDILGFRSNSLKAVDFFPTDFLKTVPAHVVGRFVLIQQYLLGSKSEWWPYIRTLPQPEHIGGMLPALWPEDDVDFLQGTNAYVAIKEIKSTLKEEYKDAMKHLPDGSRATYTRPLYLWAYGIFTSRSFRPSLVVPEAESLDLPCAIDDFSVLLPLYDLGNHSPRANSSWRADHQSQLISLQCGEAYAPGQQVFNNYGMKTNAELLLGYGFILPESEDLHNDYVHIKTRPAGDDDLSATHIVSLRPMSDPSSVVGKSRRLTSPGVDVVPEFSRIQDSLVSTLYDAITSTSNADEVEDLRMDDLMAGQMPRAIHDKIIQALGSKLAFDMDTLDEIEVPREGLNGNQQLAVQYRDQCAKVFENALRSLANASS
ncbi:hypothetical protein JX265_009414 [Neoarthrinium moseri]|uniref:SET domain-containing protein n=1 Tax=Neoarthrinium moseri TaxID=1658444 RepID=A0A9P9WG32_9PEZI|nr:uncharacterized protein JN550_010230 [Neoarthrinium moseri]KAI1841805.1 hypothetical protein JX266_011982 [Neoarthrinium moseri]KAI1861911.1 hypothetical protein JX265_009414 [Neoarthrinium moseri]KAI1862368.1 hypothetical protein JN550_010230 [Neoarthrinium moseri]